MKDIRTLIESDKSAYEIVNEGTIGVMFKDEKDYRDFKKDAKGIIVKDMGKSKPSSDTGGWYVNIDSNKAKKLYGDNWSEAIEGDYPSAILS